MAYNRNITSSPYVYDMLPCFNPESQLYNKELTEQVDKKVKELIELNLTAEEVTELLKTEFGIQNH